MKWCLKEVHFKQLRYVIKTRTVESLTYIISSENTNVVLWLMGFFFRVIAFGNIYLCNGVILFIFFVRVIVNVVKMYAICMVLKTLETIGNCQRPVFSLDVSQRMQKITNLCKFRTSLNVLVGLVPSYDKSSHFHPSSKYAFQTRAFSQNRHHKYNLWLVYAHFC